MNQLCEELRRLPPVACAVDEYFNEPDIERKAAASLAGGQRLVLVGHSWGAHAVLRIAAAMRGSIPLVVTLDPNWFPAPPLVPRNVELALNYYQDFDVLGRAVLLPAPAFRGQLHQYRRPEFHVLFDRSPEIRAEIIAQVSRILNTLKVPPQPKPVAPRAHSNQRRQ
jgi:pimeloyl-ACP methyl ester carboxylesterase